MSPRLEQKNSPTPKLEKIKTVSPRIIETHISPKKASPTPTFENSKTLSPRIKDSSPRKLTPMPNPFNQQINITIQLNNDNKVINVEQPQQSP